MDDTEYTGKTLEEAIANAEIILKEKRENLNIDVVDSKLTSLLSLVGLGKVRIKVSIKENEDGVVRAKRITEEIIEKMKIEAIVSTEEDLDGIKVTVMGDGSGILIGRYGRTIEALQHIVEKIVNKNENERQKIIMDVEGYRDRRVQSIKKLVSKQVSRAKRIGKPFATSLMNSQDRKIVHMLLKNDDELSTKSIGDGELRKIVITPKAAGIKKNSDNDDTTR